MPRRNRRRDRRTHLPASWKPKRQKRPREWHHTAEQDERFAEADRRLRLAEEEGAA